MLSLHLFVRSRSEARGYPGWVMVIGTAIERYD
jgi:hypothetical protein